MNRRLALSVMATTLLAGFFATSAAASSTPPRHDKICVDFQGSNDSVLPAQYCVAWELPGDADN